MEAVWCGAQNGGSVISPAPAGSRPATGRIEIWPQAITFDGSHLWVVNTGTSTVTAFQG